MDVKYSRSVKNTPAFALLVEGWNELVQDSLTPEGDAECPFQATDQVLYVLSAEGDVVGAMAYRVSDSSEFVVTMAYVEITSRKKGVFKALLSYLVDKARLAGPSYVVVRAPVNDEVANRALQKAGLIPESVMYRKRVW